MNLAAGGRVGDFFACSRLMTLGLFSALSMGSFHFLAVAFVYGFEAGGIRVKDALL
jgi:hypothetical protein